MEDFFFFLFVSRVKRPCLRSYERRNKYGDRYALTRGSFVYDTELYFCQLVTDNSECVKIHPVKLKRHSFIERVVFFFSFFFFNARWKLLLFSFNNTVYRGERNTNENERAFSGVSSNY